MALVGYVWVSYGHTGWGRQIAHIDGPSRKPGHVRGRKWLRQSKRWTNPTTIAASDITGPASQDHLRTQKVVG